MNGKLLLLLAGLMVVASAQQPSSNFTGGKVTRLEENPPGQIGYFHFDAGARTKWHIHEKGQLVFVEEGVGLAQEKGGPIVELHAGQAIWCPPGVAHWHGAAPDKGTKLLEIKTGLGGGMGPPITYELDGKQYVTLMGGIGKVVPRYQDAPGGVPPAPNPPPAQTGTNATPDLATTPAAAPGVAPKLMTFVLDGKPI